MQTNPEPEFPDPNGPPVPDRGSHEWFAQSASLGLQICLGGIAALAVFAVFSQPTMGALRSRRIKWEERQQEIADVVAEQSTQPQYATDRPKELPHD